MQYRRSVSVTLLALLAGAAVGAGGCRRSEAQREAAARATAEAEEKAQQVTITSATFELPAQAPQAKEAGDEALAALRQEQSEVRARLQAELDAIDAGRRAGERRPTTDRRRLALKKHLDALERSTAQDWAALKAKIDRDLRDPHKRGAGHEKDGGG